VGPHLLVLLTSACSLQRQTIRATGQLQDALTNLLSAASVLEALTFGGLISTGVTTQAAVRQYQACLAARAYTRNINFIVATYGEVISTGYSGSSSSGSNSGNTGTPGIDTTGGGGASAGSGGGGGGGHKGRSLLSGGISAAVASGFSRLLGNVGLHAGIPSPASLLPGPGERSRGIAKAYTGDTTGAMRTNTKATTRSLPSRLPWLRRFIPAVGSSRNAADAQDDASQATSYPDALSADQHRRGRSLLRGAGGAGGGSAGGSGGTFVTA
jgi:hypothetical protein